MTVRHCITIIRVSLCMIDRHCITVVRVSLCISVAVHISAISTSGRVSADRDIRNYRTAMDFVSHRTCITFVPWDENTKDTHHLDHNGYVLLKKE